MHTGIISFCDRVGFNIKSSDVKDAILAELEAKYGIRILQKHWYRLDATSVGHLDRSPHYACLRSNGNPYYMFFSRYEHANIIYFVDKKVQPGYEKPRIILGKGRFADELFDGTVMDGEMVKDVNGSWVFLINDVVALAGRVLYNKILSDRIGAVYDILKNRYCADDLLDVCLFQVKKYFPCSASTVDEILAFSANLPYTNRGIYFWPQSLKFKPKLYNFNEDLIKTVVRKVKDNPEFKTTTEAKADTDIVIQDRPAPQQAGANAGVGAIAAAVDTVTSAATTRLGVDEKLLNLRKTENPDVFDIYDGGVKLGIAHVATLKTSKMLRSVFKDLTVAVSQPFACVYKKDFDKWEPIRHIAARG